MIKFLINEYRVREVEFLAQRTFCHDFEPLKNLYLESNV